MAGTGGWLPECNDATRRTVVMLLRLVADSGDCFNLKLWMQYVPVQCFIRALFVSPAAASLICLPGVIGR